MFQVRNAALLLNRTLANYGKRAVSTAGTKFGESPRAQANRQARIELAVAYRQLDRLGLSEGVCNHLTMMAPAAEGDGDVMLVVSHGQHWSKVSASSLIGLNENLEVVEDLKGGQDVDIAAATIHGGIRNVRKDMKCLMHAHPPNVTTLGNLKDSRLLMIHQNMLRFYKGIAYDEKYEGWAECVTEGQRLGECLGKDNDILIMCNHGVITSGDTVAAAFDKLYYLERAAMFQVMALSTNRELRFVPDHICEQTYQLAKKVMKDYDEPHFKGITEVVVSETPDVLD